MGAPSTVQPTGSTGTRLAVAASFVDCSKLGFGTRLAPSATGFGAASAFPAPTTLRPRASATAARATVRLMPDQFGERRQPPAVTRAQPGPTVRFAERHRTTTRAR